jgi:sugar phosphate permease
MPFRNRFSKANQALRTAYYGWFVVAACNGVAFITWGVAIFNQGVFLGYYVTTFGWSPATLSIGPVLFHLWAGVAGVWVGRIVDRQGPRVVLIAGAVLIALAMIGFGLVQEEWQILPVYLVLGSGFACIHTITLGKIITRWFVRHRARAMAAATLGAGLGGAILVPLNAAVIEQYGVLSGGITMAIVTLVTIIPLALFVMKEGPETLDLKPDGDDAAPENEPVKSPEAHADSRDWKVSEAMRTVAFWGLSICFALGMTAQGGYLVHQVLFLQSSLGLLGAASVVTVTTIMGMVGRIAFLWIGPRLPVRWWTIIVFALQAMAFLILGLGDTVVWLTLGSALFGLTMGIIVILQPLATAAVFGQASFGRVYGPIYMAIRVGAGAGPLIAGVLFEATGSYAMVWYVMAAALLAGVVCIPFAMARPVDKPALT